MNNYRYILASNKAPKTTCRYCGSKKYWQRYIDTITGEILPEKYGRCDHQNKCGVWIIPPQPVKAYFVEVTEIESYSDKAFRIKQGNEYYFIPKSVTYDKTTNGIFVADFFLNDSESAKPKYNNLNARYYDNEHKPTPIAKKILSKPKRKQTFIPKPEYQKYLTDYDVNIFIQNLLSNIAYPFEVADVEKVISLYNLGTVKYNGAVTFPYIDKDFNINAVQEKIYNSNNDTDKSKQYHTSWMHSRLKYHTYKNRDLPSWLKEYEKNSSIVNCLFGEHLLTEYPKAKIFLSEGQKTAIYSTLYFGLPEQSNIICLATFNEGSFEESVKALEGRDIVVFPDLSKNGETFNKWRAKAQDFEDKWQKTRFTFSNLLESYAPEADRVEGKDIADYLIKLDWRKFRIVNEVNKVNTKENILFDKTKASQVNEVNEVNDVENILFEDQSPPPTEPKRKQKENANNQHSKEASGNFLPKGSNEYDNNKTAYKVAEAIEKRVERERRKKQAETQSKSELSVKKLTDSPDDNTKRASHKVAEAIEQRVEQEANRKRSENAVNRFTESVGRDKKLTPPTKNTTDWSDKIKELEAFFNACKYPKKPFQLEQATTVTDSRKFVKTHLNIVRANNGKPVFEPYLKRLEIFKYLLINKII